MLAATTTVASVLQTLTSCRVFMIAERTSWLEGGWLELKEWELYSTTWQLVPILCLATTMDCSAPRTHASRSCAFFPLSVGTNTTRQLRKTEWLSLQVPCDIRTPNSCVCANRYNVFYNYLCMLYSESNVPYPHIIGYMSYVSTYMSPYQ